ncbi:MAG: peroxiredoxin [Gammaproteobacteria bacterium HGW-Gammaproteobacteria-6]|nr:MAG: peroxiredoxin [Gammaproteobacteria bacterium HGW-Gammaproteobacteria-6]
MSIKIGDTIPKTTINVVKDGIQATDSATFFAGKKVVLFAVPGAFTPTCSAKHLPGFIEHLDSFSKRGIEVACVSVNDGFVMAAWGKAQNAPENLHLLADGNAEFTKALGLELDASGFGMGIRSQRFALYADNGVVKSLFIEAPGEFKVSSAEHVLANI